MILQALLEGRRAATTADVIQLQISALFKINFSAPITRRAQKLCGHDSLIAISKVFPCLASKKQSFALKIRKEESKPSLFPTHFDYLREKRAGMRQLDRHERELREKHSRARKSAEKQKLFLLPLFMIAFPIGVKPLFADKHPRSDND